MHVKSKASQLLRTTLIARKKFVDHMLAIEDTIGGLRKVHGLKLRAVHRSRFAARVETLLVDAPDLRMAIEPLLEARNMMRKHKALMDRQLSQRARKDGVCKQLMTISGVGPLMSLSFKATIDDPKRFKDSKAVAAHLGLIAGRIDEVAPEFAAARERADFDIAGVIAGEACGLINDIPPAGEIVERIVREAEKVLGRARH